MSGQDPASEVVWKHGRDNLVLEVSQRENPPAAPTRAEVLEDEDRIEIAGLGVPGTSGYAPTILETTRRN